jgi:DNA-binding winged helix-turn-helix (wHTH) protein
MPVRSRELIQTRPTLCQYESFTVNNGVTEIELPAIPIEILFLLLRKRGDLLICEEISEAIWPGTGPADLTHRINLAIACVRTALGLNLDTPISIQTVIGRGYRFVAPSKQRATQPQTPSLQTRLSRLLSRIGPADPAEGSSSCSRRVEPCCALRSSPAMTLMFLTADQKLL